MAIIRNRSIVETTIVSPNTNAPTGHNTVVFLQNPVRTDCQFIEELLESLDLLRQKEFWDIRFEYFKAYVSIVWSIIANFHGGVLTVKGNRAQVYSLRGIRDTIAHLTRWNSCESIGNWANLNQVRTKYQKSWS
jgi:hypothetical protein